MSISMMSLVDTIANSAADGCSFSLLKIDKVIQALTFQRVLGAIMSSGSNDFMLIFQKVMKHIYDNMNTFLL